MSWTRSKTYDELPALSVRGRELRASLGIVTLGWCFGITWAGCCVNGSHVITFLRMLGFDNFTLGLLGALPFLANTAQVFGSIAVERSGIRKYQFMPLALVQRFLWMAVAAIPLLLPVAVTTDLFSPKAELRGSTLTISVALVLIGVTWLAGQASVPSWFTWMTDLIPRRIRGRFFAYRDRITLTIQVVVAIGLGVLMDRLMIRDARGEPSSYQPVVLYAAGAVFAVGSIFGMLDILVFRRIRELKPPKRHGAKPLVEWDASAAAALPPVVRQVRYAASAFQQVVIHPLRDNAFRQFVLYGGIVTFGAAGAGVFYWRLCLEYLKFDQLTTNAMFLVVVPLSSIALAPLWGRLMDRWGTKPVQVLCNIIQLLAVLPWFFVLPDQRGPQFLTELLSRLGLNMTNVPLGAVLLGGLGCVLGGASLTGLNIANNGVLMAFTDRPGGSRYVAAWSVLVSVGGFAGGLFGGALASLLAHWGLDYTHPLVVGFLQWNNWHATLAVAVVARCLAMRYLARMPERSDTTTAP